MKHEREKEKGKRSNRKDWQENEGKAREENRNASEEVR